MDRNKSKWKIHAPFLLRLPFTLGSHFSPSFQLNYFPDSECGRRYSSWSSSRWSNPAVSLENFLVRSGWEKSVFIKMCTHFFILFSHLKTRYKYYIWPSTAENVCLNFGVYIFKRLPRGHFPGHYNSKINNNKNLSFKMISFSNLSIVIPTSLMVWSYAFHSFTMLALHRCSFQVESTAVY